MDIALYPNATHVLQPMDVVFFRPLKVCWSKVVHTWRMENNGVSVTKFNFAPLLMKAIDMVDAPRILKNVFKSTGLHPLNADAIDYSKLVKSRNDESSANVEISNSEDSSPDILQLIEKRIQPETLKLFKQARLSGAWNGDIKDENFFYFWLDFVGRGQTSTSDQDEQHIADVEDLQENLTVQESVISNIQNSLENDEALNIPVKSTVTDSSTIDCPLMLPIDDETVGIINNDGTIEESRNSSLNMTHAPSYQIPHSIIETIEPLQSIPEESESLNSMNEIPEPPLLICAVPEPSKSIPEVSEPSQSVVESTESRAESLPSTNGNMSEQSPESFKSSNFQKDIDRRSPLKEVLNNSKDKNQALPSAFKECLFWPEKKNEEKRGKTKIKYQQ